MDEQVMTKKELATFLKVTERTVDRIRNDGLPCFKIGKCIRFEKEKVLKWLNEKN